MAEIGEAAVRAALAGIVDPSRGVDLVAAGMVESVVVRRGNVAVTLAVDPHRGAALEPLRRRAGAVGLALPGHRPQPSPEEARLWSAIEPLIEGGGLRPPIVREIAAATAMEPAEVERFLGRATQLGLVVRVSRNRFFPPPALLELGRIAERLAGEAADGRFDAARFRDASGIGRNLTIELLEFFDRAGLTRREAEGRSLKRTAEDCFGAG